MELKLTISLEFEANALMNMNHDTLAEEIAQKLDMDYWAGRVFKAIEAADGEESKFIDVFNEAEKDTLKASITPIGARVNNETCTPEATKNNLVILDVLYSLDLNKLKTVSNKQNM